MVKSAMYVVSFALATVLSLPVFAQDATAGAATATPTVQVDGGVIMVSSDGGAFTSATSGEQVAVGSRIMVSKDSAVSVVYSDGCKQTYTKAGVYAVDAQCKRAVASEDADSGWVGATEIVGAVGAAGVVGSLISNGNSSCKSGSSCSGPSPSR